MLLVSPFVLIKPRLFQTFSVVYSTTSPLYRHQLRGFRLVFSWLTTFRDLSMICHNLPIENYDFP